MNNQMTAAHAAYLRGQRAISKRRLPGQPRPRATSRSSASRKSLQRDNRFAQLVASSLVANWGRQSLAIIFDPKLNLSAEKIARLARCYPDRQQHGLQLAREGQSPLSTAPGVYDTWDFGEVISRLRRARGLVRACALRIQRSQPRCFADGASLSMLLDEILRVSRQIDQCVRSLQPAATSTKSPPTGKHEQTQVTGAWKESDASRGLSAAAGFLRKNHHDIPLVRRKTGLCPTGTETSAMRDELRRIIQYAAILGVAVSLPDSSNPK